MILLGNGPSRSTGTGRICATPKDIRSVLHRRANRRLPGQLGGPYPRGHDPGSKFWRRRLPSICMQTPSQAAWVPKSKRFWGRNRPFGPRVHIAKAGGRIWSQVRAFKAIRLFCSEGGGLRSSLGRDRPPSVHSISEVFRGFQGERASTSDRRRREDFGAS